MSNHHAPYQTHSHTNPPPSISQRNPPIDLPPPLPPCPPQAALGGAARHNEAAPAAWQPGTDQRRPINKGVLIRDLGPIDQLIREGRGSY